MKPEPNVVAVGSLYEAWKNIGRVTASETDSNLAPYKESDIDSAAEGSLIKFELEKGQLHLIARVRLQAKSSSVTLSFKVAKNENNNDPLTGIADGTDYEKFYDEVVKLTFATSANVIAAERGGFFADSIAIVGADSSLKGTGSFNKYARSTFLDVIGFSNCATVCTALVTATWAEIDLTNS